MKVIRFFIFLFLPFLLMPFFLLSSCDALEEQAPEHQEPAYGGDDFEPEHSDFES